MHLNWGKNTFYKKKILFPKNLYQLKKIIASSENVGICGNLRSFGDTCINKKKLISLKKFHKKIYINKNLEILDVSSNILLVDILKKIVPNGYMLDVTPGSKYVTVGGMISNNVIGKNSYRNQFKYYVKEIELLDTSNKIITCSAKKNKKIFDLTIGGFGLTGIILSAKIKIKKTNSQYIKQKIFNFNNLPEFIKLSKKKTKFNVSWLDSHSLSKNKFSGIVYTGEYYKKRDTRKEFLYKNSKMNFFEKIFLSSYIKYMFVSEIINYLFAKLKKKETIVSFDDFFYPQDRWINFNDCYQDGLFQIQFLINQKDLKKIMNNISIFLRENSIKSTFIIIKRIDESGNYLNFYGKGFSISFDFEKKKNFKKIKSFFNNLFDEFKVKINLSKDIIVNREYISKTKQYKFFKNDLRFLDKKKLLSNEFSKRFDLK
jgi:hypothetical protein